MALSVTSAPFQQVAMPALDLRRWLAATGVTEGVTLAGDMAVAQRAAGANMSVDIAAGNALILGDNIANQGLYFAYNDAVFNLTGFAAAHATLPRIDRVALRVRDAFHGDAANDVAFVIVTGTATSGATLANLTGAAAVPTNNLLLANVLIPATATTVTTANIDTTVRTRIGNAGLVPVFDTTLSGAAATIDTGPVIPTTYAQLMLVIYGRGDTAATSTGLLVRLNNDSTAAYQWQRLYGLGATVTADEGLTATSIQVGAIPAASASGNMFGSCELWLPHYAGSTNHKAVDGLCGYRWGAATGNGVSLRSSGWWSNAAAVNRIALFPAAGNFVAGTRATIYAMGA